MPEDQYAKFMAEVARIHQRMTDHYQKEEEFKTEIRSKLNPMYEVFTQTKGWGNVTLLILKGIVILAAAIGALYAVVKWLKQ